MAAQALLHSPQAGQVAAVRRPLLLFLLLGVPTSPLPGLSTLYHVSCHHCHRLELFF